MKCKAGYAMDCTWHNSSKASALKFARAHIFTLLLYTIGSDIKTRSVIFYHIICKLTKTCMTQNILMKEVCIKAALHMTICICYWVFVVVAKIFERQTCRQR